MRVFSVSRTVALCTVVMIVAGCVTAGQGPSPSPTGVSSPDGKSIVPADDATGQPVAHGQVVDANKKPVPGATIFLMLEPSSAVMASMKPGDSLPETALRYAISAADGSFTIHLRPDASINAVAAQNGDYANFMLEAFGSWPPPLTAVAIGSWGFPLKVSTSGFAELPDPITITIHGT